VAGIEVAPQMRMIVVAGVELNPGISDTICLPTGYQGFQGRAVGGAPRPSRCVRTRRLFAFLGLSGLETSVKTAIFTQARGLFSAVRAQQEPPERGAGQQPQQEGQPP
jgi:hypothetical protein